MKRRVLDIISGAVIVCVMVTMGITLKNLPSDNVEVNVNVSQVSAAEKPDNPDKPDKPAEKPDNPDKPDKPAEKPDKPDEPDEKDKVEKEDFVQAPEDYFKDALFIGDSRTVGIAEYGGAKGADFFATTGMSVYNVHDETVKIRDKGMFNFNSLLNSREYGKVYLMLGINELGYSLDATVSKYEALVDEIRKAQPDAVIYIQANLHVSKSRSETDKIFNNKNIDKFNEAISEFADGEKVFYLDVNPVFDDGEGNLAEKYTSDNAHLLAKYYVEWRQWLESKAIVE